MCVCVCVCALVVQLKHALACLTSEWAGFESQCRNICHQTIPLYSSPLICKTGTWSCTAHWLCLNCPLMVVVGLRVPTPPMGGTVGTSCELLARALGVCVAPAHRTCLVRTQVPWPVQECSTPLTGWVIPAVHNLSNSKCVCSTTTHFLLKGHVGSDYSQTQSMCVCGKSVTVVVWQSLPREYTSIPSLHTFSDPLYLSLAISCSLDQFCNYPMLSMKVVSEWNSPHFPTSSF